MTKEEIQKLKELQQELLTQKPDGTRDPRLFVIMEPESFIGPSGFTGDGCAILDGEQELITDGYTKEEFKDTIENIIEDYECDETDAAKLRSCEDVGDVWDVIWNYSSDMELFSLNKCTHPARDAVFFTRKAAKEYLAKNKHHHPAGSYTYSTYPDRCEDWQLVGKLLRELDFDKLEVE